jgi:hypothetical protein
MRFGQFFAVVVVAATMLAAAPASYAQSYDLQQIDPATRAAAEQARVAQMRAIAAASRAQGDGPGTVRFDAVEGDRYAGEGYTGDPTQRQGYGWNSWTDGEYYAGQFRAGGRGGFKDGVGVYVFADGRVYEGQWLNDLRHGYGVQWEANGTVFHAGVWANGNPAQ